MGANYDMILSAGASQPQIIDSVTAFLQQQGYRASRIVGYNSFRQNPPEETDMVCFIGPRREGKRIPVVANCSTFHISIGDWLNRNPLARHLSVAARPTIYLWCFDSGVAAGYSLFLQGRHQGSQTVFSRGTTQRPSELMPRVPVPDDFQGPTSLGSVLDNPEFDYGRFMSGYRDLQDATAAFVASLGVLEHLCDFDHLARGMDAVAVIDGKYQHVSLSNEWVAVLYKAAI
jgi:hypothetical protein